MSSGTVRVTPRTVSSTSPLNAVSAMRSVNRPLKLIFGWLSTSRKSALRRWASRAGSPVQTPVASISPSNVASRQWSQSSSSCPWMSLKRPRTQVTIMWRARNSASVCPGSKIQVAIQSTLLPLRRERLLGVGCLDQSINYRAKLGAHIAVDQLAVDDLLIRLGHRQLRVDDHRPRPPQRAADLLLRPLRAERAGARPDDGGRLGDEHPGAAWPRRPVERVLERARRRAVVFGGRHQQRVGLGDPPPQVGDRRRRVP